MHSRILLIHKKGQNNAICSNMDGPGDCHTEWRKSDREGQISRDIAYIWTLKSGTDEFILKIEIKKKQRNRVTNVENSLMVTRGGREQAINWEIGICIYILLYIKWLIGKSPDAGRDWGQEEKGMTEDGMVGWHHWLNGHGFA